MKKAAIILILLFLVPNLGSHYQDEMFFTGFASPKVMIILDTSGSMAWNMAGQYTYGDGTTAPDGSPSEFYGLHEGDGANWTDWWGNPIPPPSPSRYGDQSRMYICKQALVQALDEFQGSIIWGIGSFNLTEEETKCRDDINEYRDYLPTSIRENDEDGYTQPYLPVAGFPKGDGDEVGEPANDQFKLWKGFSSAAGEENMSHIKLIRKHLDCHLTEDADEPQELIANGRTPISACLRGCRYYFVNHFENGTGKNDDKKDCRTCFVLLVTDGLPTMGIKTTDYGNPNPQVSNWVYHTQPGAAIFRTQSYAEADSLRKKVVIAGDEGPVHKDIKTFVLGIAPDDQAKDFNDEVAYIGGTDSSYSAHSPEDIQAALHAIFEAMIDEAFSFSPGNVTSIQEDFISTEYEARMYLASFRPGSNPFWAGHLNSVRLEAGGLSIKDSIPKDLLIWNAGDLLRSRDPSDRRILGIKDDNNMVPFTTGNFSASDLAVGTDGARDTVINLVRSSRADGDTAAYLGDIFHSAPLRIGSPNYFFHDDDFEDYRDYINGIRSAVVYAGSNTGLLHAFRESDGRELFAVVPKNFVPEVKTLIDTHRFYVDADPMAADIWFASQSGGDDYKDADEWGTVLMAAQGEGGRGITCLDVTYPDDLSYPKHLFSFDEDTMGLTTSVPVMFKIGLDTNGRDTLERFFAFFGGGECPEEMYCMYRPDTCSNLKGNVIVAIDIDGVVGASGVLNKGTNFWYIPAASGDATKMIYPFASAGNMINLNPQEDNLYDLFYIPDLAGQLWKVDVRDPHIDNWKARCIFRPPIPATDNDDTPKKIPAQPAFFRPLIERDPVYGCLWLFYGTGDRSHVFKPVEDSDDPEVSNRFYAIMDTLVGSELYPIDESRLKHVSAGGGDPFSFPDDFVVSGLRGWFIKYDDYTSETGRDNEKTVSAAVLLLDTLKFVTFSPTQAASGCSPKGGEATEYIFHFRTGSGRYRSMGPGLPQAPRYSFDIEGGGYEVHQTSDSIWVETKSGYGALKRILKWLER